MKIIRFFNSATRRVAKLAPLIIPTARLPPLPAGAGKDVGKEQVQSQPQPSSSTAPPLEETTGTSSKRRALLIGIQNKPPEDIVPREKTTSKAKGKMAQRLSMLPSAPKVDSNELRGCHKDVREMKQILIGASLDPATFVIS